MRLPRLSTEYIRANAIYFSEMGYEPDEIIRRVDQWLGGKEDKETHEKILAWLRTDVDWLTHIIPHAVRHYWYVAPIAWFCLWSSRRVWKHTITRLEKGLQAGGSRG